jgi:hypothetical protein
MIDLFSNRNEYDKSSRDFFGGIKRNLQSVQKYFPGYTMRLYYQVPPKSAFLKDICGVACSVPNFDLCDVEKIPKIGKLLESVGSLFLK